jgi:hypothetical protein
MSYNINCQNNAGVEVLTAVVIKGSVFWDITPSSGLKNKPRKNQAFCLLYAGFLLGLFFDFEDGGDMFLRNVGPLSTDDTIPEDRTLSKYCLSFLHEKLLKFGKGYYGFKYSLKFFRMRRQEACDSLCVCVCVCVCVRACVWK